MHRIPGFQAIDKKLAQGQASEDLSQFNDLAMKGHALLRKFDPLTKDETNSVTRVALPPWTNGYVIVGHVSDEGIAEAASLYAIDIFDADLDELGEKNLREMLHRANAEVTASQNSVDVKQFNVAVWMTGQFALGVPTHLIFYGVEDRAIGVLLDGDASIGIQRPVMAASLKQMTQGCELLPHLPLVERNLSAMLSAYRIVGDTYLELEKVSNAGHQAALRHSSDLLRIRQELAAEAGARRRDAVAAKSVQLDAVKRKYNDLEQRYRRLESDHKQALLEIERLKNEERPDALEVDTSIQVTDEPVGPAPLLDEETDYFREIAEHQADVIQQLQIALKHAQQRPQDADEPEPAPKSRRLAELDEWAAENVKKVVVLKRAIHAAKKSPYADEDFAFQALDLLATTYRDVKLGVAHRMAFKEACDKLGLDLGGSVSDAPGREYFFNWKGKELMLDQHIGKGNSRNQQFCFRTYFTWDAEEAKVIIGWTPSHLPTRSS